MTPLRFRTRTSIPTHFASIAGVDESACKSAFANQCLQISVCKSVFANQCLQIGVGYASLPGQFDHHVRNSRH